jgi:CBS domain-containing protein
VLKYTHARRRGLPTKLPVAQVMETSVMTVDLTTPVSTIVDLLLAAPFRALPVVDQQGKLQGIISTGDLIQAGVLPMRRGLVRAALELDNTTAEAVETPLEQARLSRLTAQEIMNRQVRTVRPDQPIREAAEIMLQTGLRRLPVVNAEGILLGMLSRADLLQVIVTSPVMHALVIREHALGPEHSYVGQTLNHLGLLFYHQGRYSQAEALLSRSLAIRERAPGTAHPDVASTLYTLARVYSAQEKLDKQMISLDILFSPPVQAYWE